MVVNVVRDKITDIISQTDKRLYLLNVFIKSKFPKALSKRDLKLLIPKRNRLYNKWCQSMNPRNIFFITNNKE